MARMKDTEWTFAAEVASWINSILEHDPSLPFARAKVERKKVGRRTRRDIEILAKDNSTAISGEIKLPENPEGKSPYHRALVDSAHSKADECGVDYFFTWNVNEFVLWRTYQSGVPLYDRDLQPFDVVQIAHSGELSDPAVESKIQRFLDDFLRQFARIYLGEQPLFVKPLDERFIRIVESALADPIAHAQAAVFDLYYRRKAFQAKLRKWMVQTQGWTVTRDTTDECLTRAARLSCYVAANKLLFYHVLCKRFPLKRLSVPKRQRSIKRLAALCAQHFSCAVKASGDYQTVFIEDFGGILPFLTDNAVAGWRAFTEQLNDFQISDLNYDVIGPMFERLMSPGERHRFGQHYTSPDVVDLMNSWCIRGPNDAVLDPACGGGTFLVRAYALKEHLAQQSLPHTQALSELFGVDISLFATHLATINLASRNLVHAGNFPRILRADFFDVRPNATALTLPSPEDPESLEDIAIPTFDAIVGNPPYIRQEHIPDKGKIRSAAARAMRGSNVRLSKRSDIHVYFWPTCAAMLRSHGRMGLLASSSWLDVEYGYRLQEYLLQNFKILAVLESLVEPWFTGARVATCATILEKETDPAAREDNLVRFVQLRRPLGEIFGLTTEDADRFLSLREFLGRVEGVRSAHADEQMRVRAIRQGDLYRAGCDSSFIASSDEAADTDGDDADKQDGGPGVNGLGGIAGIGPYYGSKWGIYVRAPDLFFEMLDTFGGRLAPLGHVAEVRYGLKTGADDFFYVEDITDTDEVQVLSSSELRRKYGVERRQLKAKRIVRSGDGYECALEARFLSPVVMSVMGIEHLRLTKRHATRMLFTTSLARASLRGTFAGKYIGHGERRHYNDNTFIKNRTKTSGRWYDVGAAITGDLLWAKAHQYRHVAPANPKGFVCNCRMYAVAAEQSKDRVLLAALLNTTFAAFAKEFYGRILGREGNTDTMVGDCKRMLTANPSTVPRIAKERLCRAFRSLQKRPSLPFHPMGVELDQPDRQELDEAFFACLGVRSRTQQREWRERLYHEMRVLHEHKRELELIATANRRRTARGGDPSPQDIATEIWEEFDKTRLSRFPEDFLGDVDVGETEGVDLRQGDRIVVGEGLFDMSNQVDPPGAEHLPRGKLMVDKKVYDLRDAARARYAATCLQNGVHGDVAIPVDPDTCKALAQLHDQYASDLTRVFEEKAGELTSVDRDRAKVVQLLHQKAMQHVPSVAHD